MLEVDTDYLYSDNLDHPSLSFVANNKLIHFPINCQVESGKFNSEVERKEWKNNIHRVLYTTQICQFWDTVVPTSPLALAAHLSSPIPPATASPT